MQISEAFIPSRFFFLLLESAGIHLVENLWTCLLNIPFQKPPMGSSLQQVTGEAGGDSILNE